MLPFVQQIYISSFLIFCLVSLIFFDCSCPHYYFTYLHPILARDVSVQLVYYSTIVPTEVLELWWQYDFLQDDNNLFYYTSVRNFSSLLFHTQG